MKTHGELAKQLFFDGYNCAQSVFIPFAEDRGRTREQAKDIAANFGGGMGCALIKTDVFRKCSYPWYDWVNYGDANRGMLSEDLYFCVLCRNSGIPIYSDVRVGCGHMLRHVQWPV